jgi:hypothetical protein
MIALLTNLIPIALGFFGKLLALKAQSNSDTQKLMIEALVAKNGSINSARESAQQETTFSAVNRRFVILVVLLLVALYPIAGILGVETVIPIVEKGNSYLFGLIEGAEVTKYITVEGMVKYEEIFAWGQMILEFMFGASIAQGRRR